MKLSIFNLVVIISNCLYVSGFCQPYFMDSTYVWTESPYCFGFPQPMMRYTISNEDTLINGQPFFEVLESDTPSGNNFSSTGKFIRTDSSAKVFIYENEIEYQLYDFNAEIGDTVFVHPMYGTSVFVDQIDTIQLNSGQEVKRWRARCVQDPDSYDYIVEGIGMPLNPFYPGAPCQIDGCSSSLFCMFRNDSLLYQP